MNIPFHFVYKNFDDLLSTEDLESIGEENNIINLDYENPFINITKFPQIPIIEPNLFNLKSKLSPKFEIFHFFNPKVLENKDTIVIPEKQGKKKLFLTRKKNRKEMKDNILKKIKSRFFKTIKKQLKSRLIKSYNFKKDFKFLPQKFICDISKETNKLIWNQTFLQFMEDKSADNINKDLILKAIQEDKIGNMTLEEIFNEYLNSQEFVNSIPNKENEKYLNQKYVDDYIFNAYNFINYYRK